MDIRSVSTDNLLGKTLGACRIIKELGRGSMGIVFTGYQMSLKRPVALKVLPKALLRDNLAGKRFRQEAETAAILSHPNIIPIYEIGETDELFFMVMQLVKGVALSELLERVRKHPVSSRRMLPLGEAFEIVLQLLGGLDYAHSEEVVHRDIKPANILLEGKTHRALISDFGVARELRGEDLDHGKVLGTPLYMAPEQAAGKITDGRADIYAVGVMLFELAVGELPIYDEPVPKLKQRKLNEPLGLFEKRPSRANPRVDDQLERIILKAIAFELNDRYSTCEEFSRDLSAYRDQHMSSKGRVSQGE
jgi:serine/threonine protein kinase